MTAWSGIDGLAIVVGNYFMDAAVIEGFYGLGVFIFVGAGALILEGNAFGHFHLIKTPHQDIWVMVRSPPAW